MKHGRAIGYTVMLLASVGSVLAWGWQAFGGMLGDRSSGKEPTFHIESNKWMSYEKKRPLSNPFDVVIDAQQVSDNLVKMDIRFTGAPLDPLRGVNPTVFHYFLFCVNGNITDRLGHAYWGLGSDSDEIIEYKMLRRMKLYLVMSDTDQAPDVEIGGKPFGKEREMQAIDNKGMIEMCSQMLRPEYHWF